MTDFDKLKKLCQLIRYDILTSTTEAKSGHPTTSLSAVELMATLFFGGFLKADLAHPRGVQSFANDRVVFSKGHASPLIYSLYHAAGAISGTELMQLRKINSNLEGHPTFRFKYADVATGSLGQGLSAGVGLALGIKLRSEDTNLKSRIERLPKVWVLLGDSEMAEGQVWEAIQIASYYKLNNLIAIADINRLGQSTQTMLGWDLKTYAKRIESFGWKTIIVNDGHNINQVFKAFEKTTNSTNLTNLTDKPTMILARTIKGKGVSFLENKEGWHGKPLLKDMLESALKEIGEVDLKIRGKIEVPNLKFKIRNLNLNKNLKLEIKNYKLGDLVATRSAYGDALLALGSVNKKIVALDAEMSNSTYSEKFAKKFPERYFEMFIAEQNMMTAALGMSKLGFIPFVSTFAAFLTRGFDQLRMAQYSAPNLKIVGSHCGVSIGPDGPSQMGLEDISMFRSILNSTIFYPADAASTFKLTQIMADQDGLFYLRTNRKETPVIYGEKEEFKIGGSKIHKIVGRGRVSRPENKTKALIIAAGVTLYEALKAQEKLAKKDIGTVVLDCYSVKPIDTHSINQLVKEIKNIIVVEDHYPAGGIGEAVMQTLFANFKFQISNFKFVHLCVRKLPRSGSPEELLHYEEIDAEAIVKAIKKLS
jgi:transketolase